MVDRLTNFGKQLEKAAGSVFQDADEPNQDDELVDIHTDPLHAPPPQGHNYELSFMHYRDAAMHSKPFFFTTQLGAPFPSYHCNPQPRFPARWSTIPGVKPPVESLLAPRIRLAPQELAAKVDILGKMARTAARESSQPQTYSLNLGSQALGDPYQYAAMKAFLALNREVRILNLNDNELEDITDLELPNVVKLHVSHNNFVSFNSLPYLPNCEELHIKENFLSGMEGFSESRFPKLRILSLDKNPIHHHSDLMKRLLNHVSTLEVVDGRRIKDADGNLIEVKKRH